ncbi:hypothetical protein MRX96_028263 [Rhipicephalus microplus]
MSLLLRVPGRFPGSQLSCRSAVRSKTQKSSTEEEYEEKERLLQEICSLARDFGYKIKSRKAQPSAGQRVSVVVTRDTAGATLVPASLLTFGTY